MFYIYKITNLINGKIYIGKTSKDILVRWKKHIDIAKYKYIGYSYLHKSINKYGKENFIIEKIDECATEKLCFEREIFWIRELNSNNPDIGMNISLGGEGTSGFKWSEESLDKIRGRNNHNFGNSLSEEVKLKLSKSLSAENNPFYGKKHTQEVIEFLKNRPVSNEIRSIISEGCRGQNQWNAKLTDSDIINIRQLWDTKKLSQTEIAKKYNVKPNTINQIVNRKRWTHI